MLDVDPPPALLTARTSNEYSVPETMPYNLTSVLVPHAPVDIQSDKP